MPSTYGFGIATAGILVCYRGRQQRTFRSVDQGGSVRAPIVLGMSADALLKMMPFLVRATSITYSSAFWDFRHRLRQ